MNHVENIPQQDAAERALNKLGRTFAAQMDTLKKYRTKGQQTVRVERVTVNEGGQAIVGDAQHGGGAMKKSDISPLHRRDAARLTLKFHRNRVWHQILGSACCRIHTKTDDSTNQNVPCNSSGPVISSFVGDIDLCRPAPAFRYFHNKVGAARHLQSTWGASAA
ncbi:hypothetical protein U5922_010145 [Aquicoccus sp. G2-2]|uniref:hypothetical protein n=1 Tax=Aquicoccus sp. G2-2 TaxID=3092120 RepID=UPI002AE07A41|nr:hypothetical protein [Aquicoccus sp. G2-2]MEA1113815.1 hypothetical protein [Aquicoccus sp. G2-2]